MLDTYSKKILEACSNYDYLTDNCKNLFITEYGGNVISKIVQFKTVFGSYMFMSDSQLYDYNEVTVLQ